MPSPRGRFPIWFVATLLPMSASQLIRWWTGIWNVGTVLIDGLPFMVFYRRTGALWPLVTIHYILDVMAFA